MSKKLNHSKKNTKLQIMYFDDERIASRLMELGCLPGDWVEVLDQAPFKGPLCIKMKDNKIMLRPEEAFHVIVEETPDV
jgi:ferrous iron transport protein A